MPASADVGTNMKNLNASKTKRPRAQKIAIALNEARKMGADIPPPKGKRSAIGAIADANRGYK